MKKILKKAALVSFSVFAVTFAAYITNADMKLVERIYDWLIAYHDAKHVEEKI
jgi:hypothetical protein